MTSSSATMTITNKSGAQGGTKAAWSVAVFFEDTSSRQRAVDFCDQLISRFWEQCEFEVNWWPLDLLEKAESAKQAAVKAAGADVVVFSSTPEGDYPGLVKAWIETWLTQRGDREGMLVDLLDPFDPVVGNHIRKGRKHYFLRNAAHHGAMDYLTHIPQDISFSIPDSLDSYSLRADQVTNLLDDILHRQVPPPTLAT